MYADDPAHWRKRAEENRAIADGIKNKVLKEQILDIAKGYDRLAEQAEERLHRVERRTWK